LEQRVAELEAQIAHLTKLLEAVQRASKRQAAPFRKRKNPNPRKPGRKPGDDYGQQAFRAAPTPEQITETHEAPLPAECPECQSARLTETHVDLQFQVEIPVEPIYRQFNVHVGCCQDCGTRIQGRHELQTSDALGAARSQMGPRLHAFMAILNKKFGLSHGKIQSLLQDFFQIRLSRSQSCRSMLRTARRTGHAMPSIVRSIRGSPQVVPDETGWRVGGKNAWMHVFVGPQATCYVIDRRRDDGPGKRILGENYSGILVHDGWSVYDKFASCGHQTCLAHLIRRCREMIESMAPIASRASLVLPRGVLALLTDALALRDRKAELTRVGYLRKFDQLLVRLMILIRRRYRHAASERLANHLFKHRDQLFTFLLEDGLDATNWRAEQAIRPAVVNRKVWGGNRTWVGAEAQSTLMSILATAAQRGICALDYFIASLTSPAPLPLFASPGR
jgi:transposase